MSDRESRLTTARTVLFVPANRPERFHKAASSGADLVVLDLEDAAPAEDKAAARAHAVEWLAAGGECAVRLNGPDTEFMQAMSGRSHRTTAP